MAEFSLSKFHHFDNNKRVLIPNNSDTNPGPRICVICMASYNAGILFGQWIDALLDVEIINQDIKRMLSNSPIKDASEWVIYAYEGFSSIVLDKREDIALIHQKAVFLKFYGAWSVGLLEYYDNDLELAEEAIVDHYLGKFYDPLRFAESLFDKECGIRIPEYLKLYINYEAFKEDIFRNDYYAVEEDNSVHVFSMMREESNFTDSF